MAAAVVATAAASAIPRRSVAVDLAAAASRRVVSVAAVSITDSIRRRGFIGGFGFYGPYAYDDGYYDYPYYADDSYYEGDGGCYVVQRRVHTRYGWRLRPIQVCG